MTPPPGRQRQGPAGDGLVRGQTALSRNLSKRLDLVGRTLPKKEKHLLVATMIALAFIAATVLVLGLLRWAYKRGRRDD